MALPVTNTTCDIYRFGNSPPAAPDVPGVVCYLEEHARNIKPLGAATPQYSHVLRVGASTDVRDTGNVDGQDRAYVPDRNGTLFLVQWVARVARGTALDHKIVYLLRQNPTFPTNDL
jgi:hypothetical protein